MKKKHISLISVFLALVVFTVPLVSFAGVNGTDFDCLEYPEEALTEFKPDILNRIHGEADHETNKGFPDTALYISPDWSLSVNGKETPLYSTLSYDGDCGGVLSSYQYLFAKGESFELNVKLTFKENIRNGICLPEYEDVSVDITGNILKTKLDHTGIFTFLINDDDQRYAVTIFVRKYRDENAEIASYIEQYGEENVRVFEKGYYEYDQLPFDKKVTYFCRGSFFKANHLKDVTCSEEEGGPSFMDFSGPDGSIITGMGTVDFNSLDWHERGQCGINWKKNIQMDGLLFLNSATWTLTLYASENCTVRDIAVFGYRTNSDGINVGGCSNIRVSDSFCRNGDDCFSAKACNELYSTDRVSFTNCIGWSNKARCFGITGEVYSEISDIEFSHCAIIYRNATWNNDCVCGLSVMVCGGGENIDNVRFSDIEIYHDSGRPIQILIEEDEFNHCNISGVTFENINCRFGGAKSRISTQRDITKAGKRAARINVFLIGKGFTKLKIFALLSQKLSEKYNSGNNVSVTVKDVTVNGLPLTSKKNLITEGNVFVR